MMTLISNLFETLGLMISIDKGCFIKVPRAIAVPGSAVRFGIFQGWARRWSGGRWVSGCGGWPLCDYISQVPSPPVWNNVINGTTLSAPDTTPGTRRAQISDAANIFAKVTIKSRLLSFHISCHICKHCYSTYVCQVRCDGQVSGVPQSIFCFQARFKPVWCSTDNFRKVD